MNHKADWKVAADRKLVVAPASASTWVVAYASQLIPGACFKTRTAALDYASLLATAAGMGRVNIKVLGDA